MNIDEALLRSSEEEYGEKYRDHYLDIYKLYVSMADNISSRRQSANSYFLSVNIAIIAVVAYLHLGASTRSPDNFYWLISLAGMTICFMWYRLIRSYKDLNSGKFRVVHRIEQHLPIASYDAEWEALGRGKDRKLYLPFTHVERFVPWVFFVLHLAVFIRSLPWELVYKLTGKAS